MCIRFLIRGFCFFFAKASPHIRFSKKGSLLAVSADDNQIKILANDHGRQLLQESTFVSGDSSGCLTESFRKVSYNLLGFNLFCCRNFSSECLSVVTAFCRDSTFPV